MTRCGASCKNENIDVHQSANTLSRTLIVGVKGGRECFGEYFGQPCDER